MTSSEYVGDELDIFASAIRWRSYWGDMVAPHLGTNVLEVGAGIGSVTSMFSSREGLWTALEPDLEMVDEISNHMLHSSAQVMCGTVDDLGDHAMFDTVLYIDVLEHIDDDRGEIEKVISHLQPGGRIIVLAPAHNFLFSPFDTRVGHFRRYSTKSLDALRPANFSSETSIYLDSLGLLASATNKLLLRQNMPSRGQILFWDRLLIPLSQFFDPLLSHRVGKSVLTVWRKPANVVED